MKLPKVLRKLIGRFAAKHPCMINRLLKKKDIKNRLNDEKNPGSFVTETKESTAEYAVNYHNLYCLFYAFAKQKNLTEYMSYLCNMDYVIFGSLYLPLYRSSVISDGDEYCDFRFKVDAPIPSIWPPHILDKKDPLK